MREKSKNKSILTCLPWFALGYSPRRLLTSFLEADPQFGIVVLSILQGLTAAVGASVVHGLHPLPDLMGIHPLLDDVLRIGLGESPGWGVYFFSLLIYGSTLGIVLNILGAFFLRTMGVAMGGSIGRQGHRAAIAWSFTPYIMMLPVWIIYALFNVQQLRMTGINYGPVMPWDTSQLLGILLTLDYALRLISLFYLALSYTIVQKISFARAGVTVGLALIPFGIYFATSQAFGF